MAMARVEGPAVPGGAVSKRARSESAASDPTSGSPITIDLRSDDASIAYRPTPSVRPSRGRRIVTRIFDLTIAVPALAVSFPVLLVVALAVSTTSAGPVLHRSPRLTRDGRRFAMWKFRSMVVDGDAVLRRHFDLHPEARDHYHRFAKLPDDPRVTRVGRFIRRWSLDELPQLVNVVRGHMSIVGPRPMLPSEAERFGPALDLVTVVKSGITGTWQVSGRSSLTFEERVVYDVRCATERSLLGDITIVARTAGQLLGRRSTAF